MVAIMLKAITKRRIPVNAKLNISSERSIVFWVTIHLTSSSTASNERKNDRPMVINADKSIMNINISKDSLKLIHPIREQMNGLTRMARTIIPMKKVLFVMTAPP
ncbi:TPA: hypothetical protein DDZ75_04070 [Patescibacteria group bacterium]|nr:hypothetical protein [Patescibacteria group bacterium]